MAATSTAEPIRTGSGFLGQIKDDVAETARAKRSMTLVVAAIKDLARLNDEFGSDEVDRIIGEVTSRIRSVMRRRDKLVRYSGNRFALALLSCPSEQADTAIARLASLIQSEPIATARGPALVRLCIGAAAAPQHATDAAGLLRRAEEAMAVAKRGDRGSFVLYDASLSRDTERRGRGAPSVDVIEALNTRRIVCARQPIVDARSRAVAFSEALLRIRTPEGRVVSAGDVVPAIERAGLVSLVDGRMLEMTADYLHAHPEERMSINVSPLTIEASDWLGTLAAHRRPAGHRLASHHRGDRDGGGARSACHPRPPRRHESARRRHRHRRFRRRAYLVQASAQLPGRHPQDRRGLRAEPGALKRRPLLRAHAR